jgi:hypothetical protein
MEEFDLTKSLDELLKPTEPPEGAALKNTTEAPNSISLESILPRLPPEGQENGLRRRQQRELPDKDFKQHPKHAEKDDNPN